MRQVEASRATHAEGSQTAVERDGDALRIGDDAVRIDLDGALTLLAEPVMLDLYEHLRRLARSSLPVLLTGETGTGKEHAALAIHHHSDRRGGPLVVVNCAALPEHLIESELFGHVRGAFSGALADKIGRLEAADGGTVFLDEVGELSPIAQAKLLRSLAAGVVSPVGSVRDRKIECRIVAATNRDLAAEIAAGRFRDDLYFRLAGATVRLPPLRERPREVVLLARHFLALACRRLGRAPLTLSDGALAALVADPLPGNVRELRSRMELVAAIVSGDRVEAADLPACPSLASEPPARASAGPRPRRLADEVAELEARRMREALEFTRGHQRRAAERIGMPLRTFVTKMRKYGLRGA